LIDNGNLRRGEARVPPFLAACFELVILNPQFLQGYKAIALEGEMTCHRLESH